MLELDPVGGRNPFDEHPILRTIWPAEFGAIAEEAAVEAIAQMPLGDAGGLYLVKLEGRVIGITGFFYAEDIASPYLRWHGIIPAERRKGYSRAALELLIGRIREHIPHATSITELVPETRTEYGEDIEKHFAALGFRPYGDFEAYDWSPYPWQPVRLFFPEGS